MALDSEALDLSTYTIPHLTVPQQDPSIAMALDMAEDEPAMPGSVQWLGMDHDPWAKEHEMPLSLHTLSTTEWRVGLQTLTVYINPNTKYDVNGLYVALILGPNSLCSPELLPVEVRAGG